MGKDGNGQDLKMVATDLDAPRTLRAGGGLACVFTSRRDKTSANQDGAAVVCCDSLRCVLAVADGMGGHPSGGSCRHRDRGTLRCRAANTR